ncbi:hypothetical protein [Methylobacterium sp. 22177]|uniref:hypothetical protein n=1 Tax=Methylobacterium sp. 22177 TaxID=3453885 RepID=UPI003F846C2B
MTGAIVAPTGVQVFAAVCREDPASSFVKLVADLPVGPASLNLSLDRETALLLAQDLCGAVAQLEKAERGRDDG